MIHVVERKTKQFSDGDYGPYNFGINRKTTEMMFAFDAEGNYYKCDGNVFGSVSSTATNANIKITLQPFEVESMDDLEALFAEN